jgi:hypothetical protein
MTSTYNRFTAADKAEGRRLVKLVSEGKWGLGDLTLKRIPMGTDTSNNGSRAELAKFASDIGIESRTLASYRDVAAAWPLPIRVGSAPWSSHREMAGLPDRALLLKRIVKQAKAEGVRPTVDYIRDHTPKQNGEGGHAPTHGRAKELTPDQEIDVARRVLSNPEAARVAMADPVARQVGSLAALQAVGDEADLRNPNRLHPDPEPKPQGPLALQGAVAPLMLSASVNDARRRLIRGIREYEASGHVPDDDLRELVEETLVELFRTIEVLRATVSGGITDAELAAFLGEQS